MRRLIKFDFIVAAFYLASLGSPAYADSLFDSVHGYFSVAGQDYFHPVNDTNSFLGIARTSLSDSFALANGLKLKTSLLAQVDPVNDSASERKWIDCPEDYLQYKAKGWNLLIGFNTYTWGVTDGYNPIDVVSARRYQDPLNLDKLGSFSTSVKKEIGNFSAEFIYIPWQRRTVLPGDHSRWLPREVFTTTTIGNGSQVATLNLPPNLQYQFQDGTERESALKNNIGFRLSANSIMEGMDLSFEGFDGAAMTPAIDIGATGTVTSLNPIIINAGPNIQLTPVYFREQVLGGTWVYATLGMIFRFETAITRVVSKGSDLPGHSEQYVFEMERTFTVNDRDLTVILEGAYGKHEEPLSNATTSVDRIFDQAGIVGARYSFSDKFSATANALLDLQAAGRLWQMQTAYKFTDDWTGSLSVDVISGPEQTPIGSFSNNDRVTLLAKRSF